MLKMGGSSKNRRYSRRNWLTIVDNFIGSARGIEIVHHVELQDQLAGVALD
jgi:hypothetical protein